MKIPSPIDTLYFILQTTYSTTYILYLLIRFKCNFPNIQIHLENKLIEIELNKLKKKN